MTRQITAAELATLQAQGPIQLVDICSPTEYAAGHLPGAINVPMEQIETRIADLRAGSPVVLICKSGQRAAATAEIVEAHRLEVLVLQGGTRAWAAGGGHLVISTRGRWSPERQVRLAAGLLVLTGVLLSVVWSRGWIALSAFIGLGLTFAGVTDICGMAFLLSKMPWNKAQSAKLHAAEGNMVDDHQCPV